MKTETKDLMISYKDGMITDKDKTGQITEFRLTYSSLILAQYCFTNKTHYGFENVSLTEREDGRWSVNWDRKSN